MAAGFTPPPMLSMPYRNEADRRAAQEDAFMRWSEARELHARPADERAALDAATWLNNPGVLHRVEAAGDRCTDPAASSHSSKRKAA